AREALVIVGELLHVRERDLAGEDRVVASHVRLRIVTAVLVLDVHAGAKLLEIETTPIDADGVADALGLLDPRSMRVAHLSAAFVVTESVSGCAVRPGARSRSSDEMPRSAP